MYFALLSNPPAIYFTIWFMLKACIKWKEIQQLLITNKANSNLNAKDKHYNFKNTCAKCSCLIVLLLWDFSNTIKILKKTFILLICKLFKPYKSKAAEKLTFIFIFKGKDFRLKLLCLILHGLLNSQYSF